MDEIDLILQLKARKDDHLAHAAAAAMERASIESRDALDLLQAKISEARISLEHGEWDNAKEALDDAQRLYAGVRNPDESCERGHYWKKQNELSARCVRCKIVWIFDRPDNAGIPLNDAAQEKPWNSCPCCGVDVIGETQTNFIRGFFRDCTETVGDSPPECEHPTAMLVKNGMQCSECGEPIPNPDDYSDPA